MNQGFDQPDALNLSASCDEKTAFPLVDFAPKVTRELERLTLDGFQASPRRGTEVGGILIGKRSASGFDVEDYLAVTIEYRNGPSYTLSDRDWASWDQASDELDHDRVIGLFRSHTRPGFQLFPDDSRLAERVLPGRQGVFLLLKPVTVDSVVASLFLSEGGTIVDEIDAPRAVPFGTKVLLPTHASELPGKAHAQASRVVSMPRPAASEPTQRQGVKTKTRLPAWVPVSALLFGILAAVFLSQFVRPLREPSGNRATAASPSQPESAIKSRLDSSEVLVAEKPHEETSTSSVTTLPEKQQSGRGNRTASSLVSSQVKNGGDDRAPGRLKRFFRGVGSKAARIWPFRSNKSQEPNH